MGTAQSHCCAAQSGSEDLRGLQVFVSHCKRTEASEDRAIWVADLLDAAGFKAWFDRSDLDEITMEVRPIPWPHIKHDKSIDIQYRKAVC